jgi:hypothetical protein
MSTKVFYLLECSACTADSFALIMPFGTAEKRVEWAREHTAGTGHTEYLLAEESRTQDMWPSDSFS